MIEQSNDDAVEMIWYCCIYPNCENHYNTKFNLKQHIENFHLKIKHYQCQYCKKLLISKQNFIEHLNIHKDSTPFQCDVCEKSFRQASQLSLHKRSHAGKEVEKKQRRNKKNKDIEYDIMRVESAINIVPIEIKLPEILRIEKEEKVTLPAFASISRRDSKFTEK
ncbi:unnamed protein product [Blepharisma stoltei]|uniref:C2H2-type domain-containing protein n=1 Tax=Blepharisma stoltei TaxID=1481888 RepID=A0AAU9KDW5_9CILI|nr:unnamed protein product [Blepharisma stoltei]